MASKVQVILLLRFQHKEVVRLAFVGNFSCHPLCSDHESTFKKLMEDIQILVYFLQLRLQHLGNHLKSAATYFLKVNML